MIPYLLITMLLVTTFCLLSIEIYINKQEKTTVGKITNSLTFFFIVLFLIQLIRINAVYHPY